MSAAETRLLAAQAHIAKLEATLATRERQLSELRTERQEGKYSYRRCLEAAEATLARVRNAAADMRCEGWHPERQRAGATIEAALAPPAKP